MKTSRVTRAVEAGFQVRFCRFVLIVIHTVAATGMRAQATAREAHLRFRPKMRDIANPVI
jgi:hypothetical protein